MFSVLLLSATAQAASLVPSGASSGCTAYLNSLDSSSSMGSCVSSLLTAASAWTSATNAATASSATTSAALDTLCATGCSDADVRTQLAAFYAACSSDADLALVQPTFDVLYVMNPLKNAVCSKDANGKYCLFSMGNANGTSLADAGLQPNTSSTGVVASVKAAAKAALSVISLPVLARRADQQTVNITAVGATGMPFLFLAPGQPQTQLCTFCARNVLAAYLAWEANYPYPAPMASSALLAGQPALINGVSAQCGPGFIAQIESVAGVPSASNVLSGATFVQPSRILAAIAALSALTISLL